MDAYLDHNMQSIRSLNNKPSFIYVNIHLKVWIKYLAHHSSFSYSNSMISFIITHGRSYLVAAKYHSHCYIILIQECPCESRDLFLLNFQHTEIYGSQLVCEKDKSKEKWREKRTNKGHRTSTEFIVSQMYNICI